MLRPWDNKVTNDGEVTIPFKDMYKLKATKRLFILFDRIGKSFVFGIGVFSSVAFTLILSLPSPIVSDNEHVQAIFAML